MARSKRSSTGYKRPPPSASVHKESMARCFYCGELVQARIARHGTSTCGMEICQAMRMVHPTGRVIDHSNYHDVRQKGGDKYLVKKLKRTILTPNEVQNVAKLMDSSAFQPCDWSIHGYRLSEDRRGLGAGRDTIWGFLSRKKVFLKAQGNHASKPALVIRRASGVSVQDHIRQKIMPTGSDLGEQLIDIFYAWRCRCGSGAEKIYETIDDLPNEDGYHDACRNCGAAPLEVITC